MALDNQTAVVFGGTSGIGFAIARRLSGAGARVVVTGRDRDKLQRTLAELGGANERVRGELFDARDRQALDAFFARTGPIDHLVLSLGGGEGAGEFLQLDLQVLRRGFEDKFWPQVEAAQASLATLRPGGTVTFITGMAARLSSPGIAGLAAINGALEAMIENLARELGPVRVNAVSPGVIDTPWWDRFPAEIRDGIFRQQAETLPVGRMGRADDVAQAAQFLIESRYMTGTVIECDGGMHLV